MTTGHPYLRRRVRSRPVSPSAAAADAAAKAPAPGGGGTGLDLGRPAGSGLDLGRPAGSGLDLRRPASPGAGTHLAPGRPATGPTPGTPATRSPAGSGRGPDRTEPIRPFAAPRPEEIRSLGLEDPVVRIDRRRSAVGALVVTGATSVAWESTDWTVGAATVDGQHAGRSAWTSGNRPLVGYEDDVAMVTLRHVRELRRALFMPRGDAPAVASLPDGTVLAVDRGDATTMVVLAVSVIDGELELRAEPFARSDHDGIVFAAFGFELSPPRPGR